VYRGWNYGVMKHTGDLYEKKGSIDFMTNPWPGKVYAGFFLLEEQNSITKIV
jgi:hypothetical protein